MFVYWRVVYIAEDTIVDGSIVCDVILDEEIALLDKEDVTPFFLDPSDMSSFQLSKTIWDMIRWWVRGSFLRSVTSRLRKYHTHLVICQIILTTMSFEILFRLLDLKVHQSFVCAGGSERTLVQFEKHTVQHIPTGFRLQNFFLWGTISIYDNLPSVVLVGVWSDLIISLLSSLGWPCWL